jgi:hypothetical protein
LPIGTRPVAQFTSDGMTSGASPLWDFAASATREWEHCRLSRDATDSSNSDSKPSAKVSVTHLKTKPPALWVGDRRRQDWFGTDRITE